MSDQPDAGENVSWRQLRGKCLARDHNCCQRCNSRSQLTAHHLNPRDWGGPDVLHNLITLCTSCHDLVEVETADKGRALSRSDIQGSWQSAGTEPAEWQGNGVLTRYFARIHATAPPPQPEYTEQEMPEEAPQPLDSRILPDDPGMYRLRRADGSLTGMVNLTRAKEALTQ